MGVTIASGIALREEVTMTKRDTVEAVAEVVGESGPGVTKIRSIARFTYNGSVIRADGDMLNLTDMWRAAGADTSRAPYEWSRKEGSAFIESLPQILNTPLERDELIRTVRGGTDPCTKAHWQIGLAYAKYLSHEFHAWCNGVVRAEMEGRRNNQLAVADPAAIAKLDQLLQLQQSNSDRLSAIEEAVHSQPKGETKFEATVIGANEGDIVRARIRHMAEQVTKVGKSNKSKARGTIDSRIREILDMPNAKCWDDMPTSKKAKFDQVAKLVSIVIDLMVKDGQLRFPGL